MNCELECKGCIYENFAKIPATKIRSCSLAIVGESPGNKEIAHGNPFIGPSGKLLDRILATTQLPQREDIFITNALLCKPPKGEKIKVKALFACQPRLISEIKKVKPKLIIALGNPAIQSLMDDSKLKITAIHGKIFNWKFDSSIKVIPIFHPAAILRSPDRYGVFANAFNYASKIFNSGKVKSVGETKFKIIETEQEVDEAVTKILAIGSIVGIDIETGYSLNPRRGTILCFGVCYRKHEAVIFPSSTFKFPAIMKLLSSDKILLGWQNGQYDTSFWHVKDYPARIDHDSILLHYSLHEHEGGHNLAALSAMYLGADSYKDITKSFVKKGDGGYQNVPEEVLFLHLAKDCDYTYQLIIKFLAIVENDPLLKKLYYRILIPATNFLQRVQQNGFYVDMDYCKVYRLELIRPMNKLKNQISNYLQPLWDRETYLKETGAKSATKNFNPASNKQLAWMVFDKLKLHPTERKGTGGRSVDIEIIEDIKYQHPAMMLLIEYRRLHKILSTYVDGVLKRLDSDGRVRTQFKLHGTVTGRLASAQPDLQNIKRDFKVKNIFCAPKGRLLLESDFSQVEVRILAYLSGDKYLTEIFRSGKDLHDQTASDIFGKDFSSEQRVKAKGVNFGIAYGLTSQGLANDIKVTELEAQYIIDEWFANAKEAHQYLLNCDKDLEAGKIFTTPFGRKRRYGLIDLSNTKTLKHLKNEARNFAIQSIASDLTLLSAMEIEPKLGVYSSKIVNLVHDSIIIEVLNNKKIVQSVAEIVRDTMIKLPKVELETDIPFEVDLKIGRVWGNMKELKI